MIILKSIVFVLIFCTTTLIGIIISNKYKSRVKELKEIKTALNVLETKMKYTYEPIAEIFKEIVDGRNSNISNIFKNAVSNMYHYSAGDAWTNALDNTTTNLNKEDILVLKNLNRLLGKTNLEGQVSEIQLTTRFLDTQIEKAEKEREKNQKLYKNLGIIAGLTIIIILI